MIEILPTFHFVENSTKDDTARKAIQQENSTRAAVVEVRYISRGTGQHRITKPLTFTTSFIDEPRLTTGTGVVKNPDPDNWNDPIGAGGVYMWAKDSKGLYVGALVYVRVDMYAKDPFNTDDPPRAVRTCHYFTFSGIGVKDIPTSDVTDELTPRTVDYIDTDYPDESDAEG
jgi:hypothetical protein